MQPTTTTEIIIYNSGQSDPPLEVRSSEHGHDDVVTGPKHKQYDVDDAASHQLTQLLSSIVHILSESIASLREIDIYLIDKVY